MATFAEFYLSLDEVVSVRGKQFERFCKWYLENDPYWKNEVEVVWLWEDYPDRWANKDLGVDLVFRDKDKNIWAVQAKCYDPDYYIKYEDMATFIAESNRPQIQKRLLITSTDNLGKNAVSVLVGQDNKPVIRVMLSDFVKSNLIFPDHPNELKKAKLLPKPEPVGKYDYQLEPINAVAEAFKTNDRGQLIMACGTGKTFTTLWIKEKLNSESTLILLPSLSLLSQTLTEWNFAMNQDFRSLAVCSDESVTKGAKDDDRSLESVSDLPFPVTSDPTAIASFLKSQGRKVIFSTYQSSQMIAEAMGDSSVPLFDLVIADEAHRCTGNMESAFATVLDESKIRTKKKLFTTATPRTYSTNIKQAAEERDITITGMDDESIFGPVFFRLSFGEAIRRGLLTDYQLVIIGVDDGMIAEYINNRELISTEKEKVTDAKSLAAMIGLLKAVKDYDLKRLITFHSRVSKARDFSEEIRDIFKLIPAKDLPEGVIATDYVSGQMPTGQRRQKLEQLKELTQGDRMILSNARCLSEGVDVPALDAVAIIDPRQSTVDIVQTVGRAIRLSKDKKVGTIVMPVFLEPGDDAESVIEDSNFKPIWDVVNALKSHDDSLSFELDAYRTGLGKDKKSSTHVTGLTKIVIDLPNRYDTNFAESIKTVLLENVTASWHLWFGMLQAYEDRFGDTLIHKDFKTDLGYKLGHWVNIQRNKKDLLPERIAKLETLKSWVWDTLEYKWQSGFDYLKEYQKENLDCLVPARFINQDGYHLGSWVSHQRKDFKSGILTNDHKEKLEGVKDWTWDPIEEKWISTYKLALKFVQKHGSIQMPKRTSYDGVSLADWLQTNRSNKNRLSAEKKTLIEALPGWSWNPFAEMNERRFSAIQEYLNLHGDANIPQKYVSKDGINVGSIVSRYRQDYKKGVLDKDLIAKLNSFEGWSWNPYEDLWLAEFKSFEDYVSKHENTSPPDSYRTSSGFSLKKWVFRQREKYRKGTLPGDQISMIESIKGWSWDVLEDRWDEGFNKLIDFYRSNNNILVESRYIDSSGFKLGAWVGTQRIKYKSKKISNERISKLESIKGWVWIAKNT